MGIFGGTGAFEFAQDQRLRYSKCAGWSSLVARQAHNLKIAGSNPAPATKSPRVSKIYRVYVLQNRKRHRYIGFTESVALRVQQHNSGMTPSTRGKGPWELIWQSDRLELTDARRFELNLK